MKTFTGLTAASALMAASLVMPAIGWAQQTPAPAAPAASAPAAGAPGATTPATGEGSGTAAPAPMAHHGHHGHAQLSLTERVEQHIKMLHTQLHITAAEEPQWTQFAQVMRDNAQAMSTSLNDREAKLGAMNAVDSMSSYAQLADQRAQDLMKLSTAFQTLYASFPGSQKQLADTLFQRQAEAHVAHEANHKG